MPRKKDAKTRRRKTRTSRLLSPFVAVPLLFVLSSFPPSCSGSVVPCRPPHPLVSQRHPAPRAPRLALLALRYADWPAGMPHSKFYRNYRSVSQGPRRAYEKERLDNELKICGEYGLRAKKEIWRVNRQLAHCRKAARVLLTLDEKDPKRLFEGSALLKRLTTYGLLDDTKQKLEYILELETEAWLERRLQTQIWKLDMAKSIHHARVLIKQRHIRVERQIVNVPSFMVRLESQKHIDFALTSPFGGGPPGRVKKKKLAAKGGGEDDE